MDKEIAALHRKIGSMVRDARELAAENHGFGELGKDRDAEKRLMARLKDAADRFDIRPRHC